MHRLSSPFHLSQAGISNSSQVTFSAPERIQFCACGGSERKKKNRTYTFAVTWGWKVSHFYDFSSFMSQLYRLLLSTSYMSASPSGINDPYGLEFLSRTQNQAFGERQHKEQLGGRYFVMLLHQLKATSSRHLKQSQAPGNAGRDKKCMDHVFHSPLSLTHQCNGKLLWQPCWRDHMI